ncbi:hypothetical protein GCM10018780_88190 [Streptomyces lanatus]|nr:hypothetical protein GCM10018780_88190 [Streptomyces lanatus]
MQDDAHYGSLASQMAACPDIDRVYIKDPGGLLTPERAVTLIPAPPWQPGQLCAGVLGLTLTHCRFRDMSSGGVAGYGWTTS